MEAQSPPSKILRTIANNGRGAASVNYGVTMMQLQEIDQQLLIYSYLEAGITVPIYLILPIWRSFPTSISHKLYPNLLNYNPQNSKDQEPGRCKRTDGRKWRCTKSVVQGHKYCSAHIHRGRLQSKNHVQPPPPATTATTTATATEICM